jgi:hypothetical protein
MITENTAEIPFVAVPEMKLSDLLNIWVGCVGNINELPVDKVGKQVLVIGLPPLLCFGGSLGWHRAEMEKGERSCACVVVCDPGQ